MAPPRAHIAIHWGAQFTEARETEICRRLRMQPTGLRTPDGAALYAPRSLVWRGGLEAAWAYLLQEGLNDRHVRVEVIHHVPQPKQEL